MLTKSNKPAKSGTISDFTPARQVIEQFKQAIPGGIADSHLIPLLQELQAVYGYLPVPVLEWVSGETGIPTSRMYGVITFYAQFYLEPHGKHTVCCCRGTACHVRGAREIREAVEKKLGVRDGETTEDMLFSFETVACLGACAFAPVMVVDNRYYGKMNSRKASDILSGVISEEKG